MVSDNTKRFKTTAKWLKDLQQSVDINKMLAKLQGILKFNLSRIPWLGRFLKRMVDLLKKVLYKLLGKSRLTFQQMKEVLLEVAIMTLIKAIVSNQPVGYLEDDIQLPSLTLML